MSAPTLPERFDSVAALEDFLTEPTPELSADLAQVARRHPRARRRRQDGADAGAHGQAGGAGQARRRRRALLRCSAVRTRSEAAGIETIACDLLDRRAVEALPKLAQRRLHGGHEVRRVRQSGADLGHERARPGHRRRDLRGLAHRRLLDGVRLSVRAGGRRRRDRGHAGHAAAGRLRLLLRRPRAHVRAFLRAARHARPHRPPQLRHRHALRRAARHRRQGARRASRSTSPWATSTSSGRAMPTRSRCAAWRTPPRRPRRINVTGPADAARALAGRGVRPALRPRAEAHRQRGRPPAGSTMPRAWSRSSGPRACRSSACSTGPPTGSRAAGRATASRPTTRCAMAASDAAARAWPIERLQPADAEGAVPAVDRGRLEPGRGRLAADDGPGAGFGVRGADGPMDRQRAGAAARARHLLDQHGAGDEAGARQGARHAPAVALPRRGRGDSGAAAGLDATELGRPIYLPLGLPRRLSALALARAAGAPPGRRRRRPASSSAPAAPDDLPRIVAYDRPRSGFERSRHPARISLARAPALARVAERADGTLAGYALGRDGHRALHVGPVVAEDEAIGLALLSSALAATEQPRDRSTCRTGTQASAAGSRRRAPPRRAASCVCCAGTVPGRRGWRLVSSPSPGPSLPEGSLSRPCPMRGAHLDRHAGRCPRHPAPRRRPAGPSPGARREAPLRPPLAAGAVALLHRCRRRRAGRRRARHAVPDPRGRASTGRCWSWRPRPRRAGPSGRW